MCTDCHNFHRGKGKRLLKTGMPNLCYGCHRKETLNGPVTHAPIALGMCVSCHEPHQSDLPKLKKADAPGMCLGCHEEPKGSIHSAENRKACLKCHNPHASSNRYLL
jgi:predicted CXXCH cytochrome family protein